MARTTWLWLALAALVALVSWPAADAAEILAVISMPAPSHLIVFTALTRALAERGHRITLVAALETKTSKILPTQNHTIVITRSEEVLNWKQTSVKRFMTEDTEQNFATMLQFFKLGPLFVKGTLDHPDVKALLAKKDLKFDLVIAEAFFLQEAMVALGHKFDCPVIALNPFGTSPQLDDMLGNPVNPSWVPNVFLGIPDRMTFQQRIVSTLAAVGMRLMYYYFQLPMQQQIVSEYFPDAPPLLEMMESRLALAILNNHFTLNYPVPMSPAVIEAGGMHIKDKPKPLPADLKQLMDSAKEGVVYFSMGSNLRMEFLPEEKVLAIFNSLGSLKERVLLKWDGPVPKRVADNIRIIDWAPQADILAHPNLRLFVTHGGLLSTQESVYHGVPLVGIPVFADQSTNMGMASQKGFCVQVPFRELTEKKLTTALKEVLGKPSYREAAGRLSRLFRSKPMKPVDLAVFWVEHVIEHGGRHLRPSNTSMPVYQLLLVDVVAVLLLPLALVLLLVRAVCRWCCCRGGQQSTSSKERRNKKNN